MKCEDMFFNRCSGIQGFRFTSAALITIVLLFSTNAVSGQSLDNLQKKKLEAAKTALKNVETNLNLALSSAGSGTEQPQGSKAKLTKVRLDSAAVNVPEVKKWLQDLPTDQADVQTVQTALDAAEASIAKLNERLAGKATPAEPEPVPATPPAAAPAIPPGKVPEVGSAPMKSPEPVPATSPPLATVKLDYKQVDVLKGAKFNLREVEGSANELNKLLQELNVVKDQLGIDNRRVQVAMKTIENGQRKAGFTKASLDQLPVNGDGVAEVANSLAAANKIIENANQFLKPLHEKLTALIDPANYPQFKTDLDRLNALSSMYYDPTVFESNRPRAAQAISQSEVAKAEVARIVQLYKRLIEQKTELGVRIEGSGTNFVQSHRSFLAAAENVKQSLPTQILADLAEVKQLADQAVNEQKPLFFTGGIVQQIGFVNEKLDLYRLLDPVNAKAVETEVEQFSAKLKQQAKSLEALIVQQNSLPLDQYLGADRDQIVAVAVDAWKHQQKDFEVLTNRIPSASWARETSWQFSNGTWYFVDRSKLQVQLIVADKTDKGRARILPINIWKDHQKGDSLIGTPLYSGREVLPPHAFLMRDKIK